MAAPVPVCVIGGGSIGLRHATEAAASDTVDLSAVVEPDAKRRAELQGLGLPAVAELTAVPSHTRGAIIATPTPDHRPSSLAAIDRGWAVLVEKPLTHSIAEADQLCAGADKAGVLLATGHHRRFHPFVAAAKEMRDKIGDLVAVQGLWSLRKHDSYYDVPWRREPGAGPILTNLSHEIDLIRFLVGEITEVSAITSNARRGLVIEDTAAITFRFANGAVGNFLISDAGASPWAFEAACGENPEIAQSHQDPTRLIGTKGSLSFPSLTLWSASGPGGAEWRKPLNATPSLEFPQVDPIREQLESFARAIEGTDDGLLATGPDGRAVVAVTEAILTAAMSGQCESL